METVKEFYDLVISRPPYTFAAAFIGMTLLGPVLASIAVHPLPFSAWVQDLSSISFFASIAAAMVTVHQRAPWLSWFAAFGITFQTLAAAVLLAAVVAGWCGITPQNLRTSIAVGLCVMSLAGTALACSLGILMDRWWGYFGEMAIVGVAILASGRDLQQNYKSSLADLVFPIFWIMQALSLSRVLLHRGKERWRVRKKPAGFPIQSPT